MNKGNLRKWLVESKNVIKKPAAVLTLAALVILVISIAVYVNLKKQVTVVDDGKSTVVTTFQNTVKDLLNDKHIALRREDLVLPSLDSKLRQGMKITIKRAFPITIHVDGKNRILYTAAPKLKDVLKENKIVLGSYDKISMPIDSSTYKGMDVVITRVKEKLLTQEEDIPFSTETKTNDDMLRGQTNVIQEGQTGKKQITLKLIYEDGKEVARNVVNETILQNPVTKIVQVGTLGLITTSRGESFRYREMKTMVATAYDYSTGSITATGAWVRRGIVAVDPNVIPIGTRLYIEGYGPAVAADTGGAIKGNIIDVFFPSSEESCNWGRRTVNVYILK
ncbi:MAG: G5 domain-containing protein [Thermoanaerobacteraceae bacterium]|nr:G5 domain-containing protein [Thermoanaerobacteraceae bacterium]